MNFNKKHSELIYQANNAPHVLDRIWAIEKLADKPHKKSIENTLVNILNNDSFYGVRLAAAEAIGVYKPRKGDEILMNGMDRQDNRVKRACIRSLRNYKGVKIRNFLLDIMMNSSNDYTVNDAYNTLFSIDSVTADSLFDWAMKQESHRDIIRKSAIRSLSKYNKTNHKRLKVLLKYGEAPWSCRSTVLSTIGKHVKRHPELIQEFEDLLFDPSRSVRTTAANLLSRYGDESHISKLENLVIRDPITDRWITPLIPRLRGEKGEKKISSSLKDDLLDIRDQLDKLIKSQQD
jgi:HEAT repeat protein